MKIWHISFPSLILAQVLFSFPLVAAAQEIGQIEEPVEEPIEVEAVWSQTDFWFRDDDGTEMSATGYGSSDIAKNINITNVVPETSFRLRFGIKVTKVTGDLIPRLEFKQGANCAVGSWTVITSTSDIFSLRLSDNFNDGDATEKQITNGSFVAGQILESTNPASSLSLRKNKDTEYEWSIKLAENVTAGASYVFRVSNNGVAFDNYEFCPTLNVQSSGQSGNDGEGGTNEVNGVTGTRLVNVAFSGKAFPGAKIFIVDKEVYFEIMVNQSVVANDDGTFHINFFSLFRGLHSFGLLVKDKDSRVSQTKFFNLDLLSTDLTVKDILVPPTVDFTQRLVTRGQPTVVIGSASPNNNIILEIDDIIKRETKAEKDGSYKVVVDTGTLEFGTHYLKVKQVDVGQGQESEYSTTNTFTISRLTMPKTDLSGDGLVDIKDLGIFLSSWGSKDENQRKTIDFNGDGKINISDFSIFIRTIKK